MKLSIGQIQSYLQQAGWTDDLIPTAAAVFYFESGGGHTDIGSYGNALGTEDSWGLAQVNRRAWPQYSVEELKDPLTNLQIAWMIYNKQGWHAWQNTYYGGRYQQYMAASNAAWQGGDSANTDVNNLPAPNTQPQETSNAGAIIGIVVAVWIGSKIFR